MDELTEQEKTQIVHQIPDTVKQDATYYLVYKPNKQKTLPVTGSNPFLPLLLGGSICLILAVTVIKKGNKEKKIVSCMLLMSLASGGISEVSAVTVQTLTRFSNSQTLQVGSELPSGKITIEGYTFIGYLIKENGKKENEDSSQTAPVEKKRESISKTIPMQPMKPKENQDSHQTQPESPKTPDENLRPPLVPENPNMPNEPEIPKVEPKDLHLPLDTPSVIGESKQEVLEEKSVSETIIDLSAMKDNVLETDGVRAETILTSQKKINESNQEVEIVTREIRQQIRAGIEYIPDETLEYGFEVVDTDGQDGQITQVRLLRL